MSLQHQSALQPNQRLQNLPTYVFALLDDLKAAARARGADLIDLGMGNPDLPTPQPVINAVHNAYETLSNHGYPPFKGTDAYRHAVADWMRDRYNTQLDPETEILCVSGSKEGIAHISMAYIQEGDYSLVPEIYYPVFSRATWLSGGQVHHLPMRAEDNFLSPLTGIPSAVLEKSRLLFLNYPNNPTGAVATLDYYREAVAFCKQNDIVLVNDMAYAEITFDGYVAPSIFEVEGAKDIAVEFHSFSKSFSMAGSRIGFGVGNPDIIRNLYALRTNVGYGTPAVIQTGAVAALTQARDYLKPTVETYQRRRDVVVDGFRSLGWDVTVPKGTLYVWLKVPEPYTSLSWMQYLLDTADVVVSPGHAFGTGGEGYFRVSLVTPEHKLQEAIDRLAAKHIRFTR